MPVHGRSNEDGSERGEGDRGEGVVCKAVRQGSQRIRRGRGNQEKVA